MKHLNGNMLCAMDIETTGLDVHNHEIYQIAIVPLDAYFRRHPKYKFFDMTLQPQKEESIDWQGMKKNNNQDDVRAALLTGIHPDEADELLVKWFNRLHLGEDRKLIPLAHNWAGIDKVFIQKWLGPKTFELIFHHQYRDTMEAAIYINDRAGHRGEAAPFFNLQLGDLCNYLKIERGRLHTAIEDSCLTAEIYNRLLNYI